MSDQELLVIVRAARDLLADPAKWSPQNFAENETGRWIPVGSVDAVRFSLEGALVKAAGGSAREAMAAISPVFALSSPRLHAKFGKPSERMTHEEALQLLDHTIARLSSPATASQSGFRMRIPAQVIDDSRKHGNGNKR